MRSQGELRQSETFCPGGNSSKVHSSKKKQSGIGLVSGLGCRVKGQGLRVKGLGSRVQGSGFTIQVDGLQGYFAHKKMPPPRTLQ